MGKTGKSVQEFSEKKENDSAQEQDSGTEIQGTSRSAEEDHLKRTLEVILGNLSNYGVQVKKMKEDIDEMLEHYHSDNPELILLLNNTITLHDHMKRALERNEKALNKPYFGRIVFRDELMNRLESLYIGKGGVSSDATHQVVVDWRAPVANAYYENGLGKCSYMAPGDKPIEIDLKLKRTYEIESGKLLDYFDSEVIANDDLLTKYLAKNKQAVLGEIVATIQKEQNDIIRKSPYHNIIVQGVAGSGKTTVAMHRISFILYNYAERFKPDDFYIVGSSHILLNYITGVLPDLDVQGVRQMTMEQLFVRLLYEDWDEKKYRIQKHAQTGNQGSVKGSLHWYEDLKTYCDELEWNSILRESIYLNPRQFVEGCKDGKIGVYDESGTLPEGKLVLLVDGAAVERYIRQTPKVSMQNKITMLNERLLNKVKEEFLGKGIKYTEAERKAILRAYRNRYGGKVWKGSIYELYSDFLAKQNAKGMEVDVPDNAFDVYDLAALAYIYKRIKETEVISEAHHIVIDEAQDYGMMAYSVLHFCIQSCTYTVMGDVSQNIHFGFGLNDWEELKRLLLPDPMDNFGVLKKSYRNTVEISNFATHILHHGQFSVYPVEPIIRHGEPVEVRQCGKEKNIFEEAAAVCLKWQKKGYDTIAVICRDQESSNKTAQALGKYIEVMESDLEKAVFGNGIMVLPVEYTKGLEFDTVLILDPTREEYPVDDGHAKLLYVAATRALHELCVLHLGNLTGLIADPLPVAKNSTHNAKKGSISTGDSMELKQSRKAECPKIVTSPVKKGISIKMSSNEKKQPKENTSQKSPIVEKEKNKQSAAVIINEKRASSEKGWSIPPENMSQHIIPDFGDIPATEKLSVPGHAKPDLAIRWITRESDGLFLQSRDGILRLSPIGSAIMRVSFVKNGQPNNAPPYGVMVNRAEKYWMYKDSGNILNLTTEEILLQIDKSTGSIRYFTRDKKFLLEEHSKESRLLRKTADNRFGSWLFLDWGKEERLYSFDLDSQTNSTKSKIGLTSLSLRGTARYISHISHPPFILSDRGYGILMGTEGPAFSCDIPAYGSYLYTENNGQMDYYFIVGKRQDTIVNAYSYLCGKL